MSAESAAGNRGFRLLEAGDSALVVEFEARVDPVVNARAIALAEALGATRIEGVRDVVSSYRAVTVYFDPLRTDLARLTSRLEQEAAAARGATAVSGPPIAVPVCYGGAFGPDLEEVAAFAKCSPDEVVRLHAAQTYRVYMLGFVPGFAYMGTVDERISAPRRATPRLRVPSGSVGIAGRQTGIYPTETPGGWRLLGRTPVRPFDAGRADPFLFKPGDTVRFEPIGEDEFRELAGRAEASDRAGH